MQSENKLQYKGQKTSQDLQNGPRAERGCTDILCLLLFLGFAVFSGFLCYFSFQNGDASKLAVPYDPDHRPCGQGELADYPYIYFASPGPTTLYRTVCLKSCPKEGDSSLNCATNSVVTSCSENNSADAEERTLVYSTVQYGGVACLPEIESYLDEISEAFSYQLVEQHLADLTISWHLIVGAAAGSILIGLIFLVLVRFSAGCVVWLIILILEFSIFALAFLCYVQAETIYGQKSDAKSNQYLDAETYYYLGISLASIGGIIALIICCFYSKISLAIAVLKCSARFVYETLSVIFVPLIFFVITFAYLAYWLVVAAYLYTCGTITDDEKSLPFAQFEYNDNVTYMAYAHGFHLLWVLAFFMASCQFVIIGTCSYWYYEREGGVDTGAGTAFFLWLRYHLGTVAFGSFIIAVIDTIRLILAYIEEQAKNTAQNSEIVNYLFKCCQCCLYCFERFIKFINKNAYVQTVMTGNGFCTATKDAFFLILRNPVRIALVAGFGEVFEWFGSLAIAAATALAGYVAITNIPYYNDNVSSPIAPVIVFGLIGFQIGSFLMGLFGTAADCIIQLFCMDEEMNVNAKYEPEELREFRQEVENRNRK